MGQALEHGTKETLSSPLLVHVFQRVKEGLGCGKVKFLDTDGTHHPVSLTSPDFRLAEELVLAVVRRPWKFGPRRLDLATTLDRSQGFELLNPVICFLFLSRPDEVYQNEILLASSVRLDYTSTGTGKLTLRPDLLCLFHKTNMARSGGIFS